MHRRFENGFKEGRGSLVRPYPVAAACRRPKRPAMCDLRTVREAQKQTILIYALCECDIYKEEKGGQNPQILRMSFMDGPPPATALCNF